MDIVIEIQSFRNVDKKFIPKEVAVVAINTTIIKHWIMMPPCPFSDLLERVRRENNWLSRNYHGIEWFDGEANPKYFALQLREIIRQARYIQSHRKVSDPPCWGLWERMPFRVSSRERMPRETRSRKLGFSDFEILLILVSLRHYRRADNWPYGRSTFSVVARCRTQTSPEHVSSFRAIGKIWKSRLARGKHESGR